MTSRTVTIEHEGRTYGGQPAVIAATSLGWQDHGILTASLTCEWPGGGVSAGGYRLDAYDPNSDAGRRGTAYGLDHVIRVMQVVGVVRWEELVGAHVMVLSEGRSGPGSMCVGLANALRDEVLVFADHAASWRDRGA